MINIANTAFTALTLFFTWLFFQKRNCDTLLSERYKKLIFPMFNTIEPHLYHKYSPDIYEVMNDLANIFQENIVYSSVTMREHMLHYNSPEAFSNEDFQTLCSLIDREYDTCCSKLGIKKRSLHYRVMHKQFRNLRQIVPITLYISISNTIIAFIFSFLIAISFNYIINLLKDLI